MSSFAGLQNPWATPQVAAAAAVTSSTSPHIKAKNNDFDEAESDASPSRRVIEYQGPPPENPATSSLHSTNTVPHQPPIGLPSSSAQNTTEDSSRAALNIYGGGEEEVEDDERTSLLFGSPFADVASNNNNNNNRRPDSSSFRRRPTSSKNIRQRRALRWIHRKSGFYDDEAEGSPTSNTPAQLLGQEGNGLRFWYNDYSTIDWIHDFVKDRVRVRQLRSIKGIRGWIFNGFDGVQAWILVFLIGIICGSIASGIDIGANYLSDVRSGYCGRDWRLDKHFCCQGYYSGNYDSGVSNNTTSTIPFFNPCPDWHHYSWILPEQHSPSNDTSDGGGGGGNGNGETLLSSFTKTSNNSTSNSNNNNTDLNNYPQSSAAYWFDYFLFVLFSCLFAFVSGFLGKFSYRQM